MGELLIFNNKEFGEIRTVEVNNKILFAASDIAKALGYKKPNDAVNQHCRATVKHSTPISGKMQDINFIPEGDIYRLIVKSKLPSAEKFEHWVFDEVLPTIRKTGGYVNNDDTFINTYLPFADDMTRLMFKTTLETVRKQNDLIKKQEGEIEHGKDVVKGLVSEITLAEKRQILNRVMRHNSSDYQLRWKLLYREFDSKYRVNSKVRMETYNLKNKPKCKNRLDYIDKVMNKIPEIYEIAAKLFESDVKELVDEMYQTAI